MSIPVPITSDYTKDDPTKHGEHAQLVTMMQSTVDNRVGQYVAIRDKIRQIKERHEAELKPLLEVQELVGAWLDQFLTNSGSTGVKTAHGTCYKSTRYTASLADADAFMGYVIKTGEFELLDRRANPTAVRDYAKEHDGNLPPGVNLNAISSVGVRRPSGKD